ncbi:MAG: hypothetical protein ACI4PG_06425 [Candidatus Ventricola sp.]
MPEDADDRGNVLVWHRYQHGMLCTPCEVRRNRFITHWMPLAEIGWTDVRQRATGAADADEMGCVLAVSRVDGIVVTGWFQVAGNGFYTHYARIPGKPSGG